jgi:hypothetical protein
VTPAAETTCGANNGTITVNVTSGTSPYQYFIDGVLNPAGATNNVFANLAPKSYTIEVVANDGCTFTTATTVAACVPVCNITAQAFSTPVLCKGTNDGTAILVNVSGGSGSYEFSVNSGVTYQDSPSFNNLTAGSHKILVRNKNNISCTAIFDVVIGTQFSVSGVIVVNQPKACQDRGSIEFRDVSGGTAPYTYSVDGVNFQTTTVFANLLIGSYKATIRDANGCKFSTNVSVEGTSPITATALITKPVTCNGDTNGEITVTISGGEAPYQYAINSGAFTSGNGVLNNLAAGIYTISVKDANNCIVSLPALTIDTPAAITASISAQANPSCSSNNGSITVITSGGTGTLSYSKDNGATFVSSNIFNNLAAGTYTIVVKDANNCTVTLPAVTLIVPVIIAQINGTNPNSCTTSDGTITINNPQGGLAPYVYSLNGGGFQNSSTFAGLSSGNYTVTVQDANGCQATLTQTITSTGGITAITIVPTAETSCGANDGKITVSGIIGATGPYEYFIDGVANPSGINSNIFSGLEPKMYVIRVVAANGCVFTANSTINASCTPNCTLTARAISTPVLCNGVENGTAELIEVSGGSGSYEYSIDGNTYQDSPVFSNLAPGTYTILVRDKNNKTCIASFITPRVTSLFNVSGVIVVNQPKSCLEKGSIEFTNVSGGQEAYSFSINGNTFLSAKLYTGLDAGNYQATIKMPIIVHSVCRLLL